MQTIRIRTLDGWQEVKARVIGKVAVHRRPANELGYKPHVWTVSDIRHGRRIGEAFWALDALRFARWLDSAFDVDNLSPEDAASIDGNMIEYGLFPQW